MAFWINVLRLLRMRIVAATVAGSTLALGLSAFFVIPTTYTSSATLVLTSSPTNQAAVAGDPHASPQINPLLNFSEGLTTALAILVQVMNTDSMMASLTAGDRSTSIKITDVGDASYLGSKGPFLFLAGTSTRSGQAAQDIVARAAQRSRDELIARQQALNAPTSQLITTLFVVLPTDPVASSALRVEGAVIGVLLGLVGTLGAAYALTARRSPERFAVNLFHAEEQLQGDPAPPEPSVLGLQPTGPPPGWRPVGPSSSQRPTNGYPVIPAGPSRPPTQLTNGRARVPVNAALLDGPTHKLSAVGQTAQPPAGGQATMPKAMDARTKLSPDGQDAADVESTAHLPAVSLTKCSEPVVSQDENRPQPARSEQAPPPGNTSIAPESSDAEIRETNGSAAAADSFATEIASMNADKSVRPSYDSRETAKDVELVGAVDQGAAATSPRRPRPRPRPRLPVQANAGEIG